MTGFAIKRPVPAAMMSAQDLEKYLKGKMKEEVNPNKVDIEEVVLKLFGFAPPDFKLKQTTLDLLQEQAAAFYDFKTKKLYVLDHVQEGLGPELLIHELGHALADQNFGLKKFLNGAKGDDDAALARMAVMEGESAVQAVHGPALDEAKQSGVEPPGAVTRGEDACLEWGDERRAREQGIADGAAGIERGLDARERSPETQR